MKLKKFSIIGLVVGALAVLAGFGIPALTVLLSDLGGHSIGIIGGADLPTFSFVFWRSELFVMLATFGIPLVLTSLFCLIFPNFVRENFSIKTTALALSISAVGGLGLTCFLHCFFIAVFNEVSKHPIEYPASIAVGVLSLLAFFTLIVLYCVERSRKLKAVGIILDILTSILYLPFFFLVITTVAELMMQ